MIVVIYSGLSVIRGLFAPRLSPRPGERPPAGGHLVKDPVCGMHIPEETALRAGDQFFCSEDCRSKFIKA